MFFAATVYANKCEEYFFLQPSPYVCLTEKQRSHHTGSSDCMSAEVHSIEASQLYEERAFIT